MLPTLVEFSLGSRRVAVSAGALAAAIVLLLAALLLRRAGRRPAALALLLLCAAALGGAWAMRGRVLVLDALPIRTYGAALFAGIAGGWWLALRGARQHGFERSAAETALLAASLGGFLGARLGYVLANLDAYQGLAEVLAVERGGLSALGAIVGGFAAARGVLWRRRLPFLAWADSVTNAALFIVVASALGAYLAGADGGLSLSGRASAWVANAGTFERWPSGTLPAADGPPVLLHQIASGAVSPLATASQPVHPVPLYDALVAVLLLATARGFGRRQRRAGDVFLPIVFLYGTSRFIVESLRGDPDRGLLPFTIGTRPLLMTGVILLVLASAPALARSGRGAGRWAGWAATSLVVLGAALMTARASGERVSPSALQVAAIAGALAAVLWLGRRALPAAPA